MVCLASGWDDHRPSLLFFDYHSGMAKLTGEQVKAILAAIGRRLRANEELTNHDFEAEIMAAGSSHKGAESLIKKHGSPFLLEKYAVSFGNHCPSWLKKHLP